MQIYSQNSSIISRKVLGQKAGDCSCQHITGTGFRHSRISGSIQKCRMTACGDQRSAVFHRTDDLLSPYEEEVNDTGEFAHRRYVRDPSRPDDFAMALCFGAMLAMKLSYSSIMDMVPRNAGAPATGKPEYAPLDPAEILRALSS